MNNIEKTQIEEDIKSLTPKELREKYQLSYSSWANMNKRAKKGAIISQPFQDFSSFLKILGSRKNKNYTLDRLDNTDPEYAEGKVRWVDKHVQNSNKSNNIYLTHDDGRKFTIAQWAELTGQKPTTLYKRKSNGWNAMEVITGKRVAFDSSINRNPFPFKTREMWEQRYRNFILSGGGLNRLEFLYGELEKIEFLRDEQSIIKAFKDRKLDIEISCQCNGDYCDQYCGTDFIDYVAESENQELIKKVREFEQYSIEQLESMAELRKVFIDEYNLVYPEVKAMYEWQLNKRKLMKVRNKAVDQSTFLNFFNSQYPKPNYTVNLPTSKDSEK